MRVLLFNPEITTRTCGDCKKWMYDDKPGAMGPSPRINPRTGAPYDRLKGTRTPCMFCPKQPITLPEWQRTPETAIELSERNFAAIFHYRECEAVGQFPADWIVRRNAAVIKQAEKFANVVRQVEMVQLGIRRGS